MLKESDRQFLARREEEELVLAISAPNSRVREAHYALANAYRFKLDQLPVETADNEMQLA